MKRLQVRSRGMSIALLVALACGQAVANGPTPVADYDLLGWFGDALGNGPALVPVGNAEQTFTQVGVEGGSRTVLSVPAGTGLRLASGPLLPLDAYSVAIIVSVADTSPYGKLLDTNNLAVDNGLYTNSNGLRYYTPGLAVPGSFPDGALRQAVVTRTAEGQYTGYLDGVLQFTFDDADNASSTRIDPARVLHVLRDDNATGNVEERDAVLHRVRLFDVALSADEVLALESSRNQLLSIFREGGFEARP